MIKGRGRQVFISYSQHDREVAERIRDVLREAEFDPWIDNERINIGDDISGRIQEGLSSSDYVVLLVSDNSTRSEWVRRELALGFELARNKKLTLLPVLLDKAPLPLELRGLLYLDFRSSISAGLAKLREFFIGQFTRISELDERAIIRKSFDARAELRRACEKVMRDLELGALRYRMAEALTKAQVEVLWFDLFHRRMADETLVPDVSLSCVELLDRARREGKLPHLVETLCRNHRHLAEAN